MPGITDTLASGASTAAGSTPVGSIAQAGLGAIQTVVGLINSGKAKREAEELARNRPKYQINPLAGRELSLTESELGSGGLSANSLNAYNQIQDREFSTSLDSILRGGGSPNDVAGIFDASEAGRQRLSLMNEQLRLNKVNNFINSSRYNTEQGDKEWQVNTFAPYMDKVVANGQARQSANQMVWSGLNTFGGGAINTATQSQDNNQYGGYFGNRGSNGGSARDAAGAAGGSNMFSIPEFSTL